MAPHKDNCPWKNGYHRSLMARDSNGPDSALRISDDEGIEFDWNDHTFDPDKDETITFEFCPKCGVRLRDEEDGTILPQPIQLCDRNGVYTDIGARYAQAMQHAIEPIVAELVNEKGATAAEVIYLVHSLNVPVIMHTMKRD